MGRIRHGLKWIWAILGRMLLYGVFAIIVIQLWHRHLDSQRPSVRERRGGWERRGRELSTHRVPPKPDLAYDRDLQNQIRRYPLTHCVVDGNLLVRYGLSVDYDHHGQVVRFCGEACVDEFLVDPASYLKQLTTR